MTGTLVDMTNSQARSEEMVLLHRLKRLNYNSKRYTFNQNNEMIVSDKINRGIRDKSIRYLHTQQEKKYNKDKTLNTYMNVNGPGDVET